MRQCVGRRTNLGFCFFKNFGGFIFYAVSLLCRRVGEQVVKQMLDGFNLGNSTGLLFTEIQGPPVTSPNILSDFERQMRRVTNLPLGASNSGEVQIIC